MSAENERYQASVLLGEIDQMLNLQYLTVASLGAMVAKDDCTTFTALAIAHAKGMGCSSEENQLARVCHDELVRHIRLGLNLNAALQAARHTEPSKSAFNHFNASNMDRLLADLQEGKP